MILDSLAPVIDRTWLATRMDDAHEAIASESGAVLLVDKPYGETSFHVVNRIRRSITETTGIRRVKVGHGGTLDPLATGLLLIATRRKTKQLSDLLGLDKTYHVRLRFGITSPSYDLERPIELVEGLEGLTEASVRSAIERSVGEHQQIPPMFSAIKQAGRPVYHRARQGEDIVLEPRSIVVRNIEVDEIDLPYASFRVECSKGTYIRSLVRDLGSALGTGAVLVDLRREAIANWKASDALTLEEAVSLTNPLSISMTNKLS